MKQRSAEYKPVLYIGDGNGDYCPTLQLCQGDYVFARENYGLAKLLQQNPPKSNVIFWNNGFDVLSHLKVILDTPCN